MGAVAWAMRQCAVSLSSPRGVHLGGAGLSSSFNPFSIISLRPIIILSRSSCLVLSASGLLVVLSVLSALSVLSSLSGSFCANALLVVMAGAAAMHNAANIIAILGIVSSSDRFIGFACIDGRRQA